MNFKPKISPEYWNFNKKETNFIHCIHKYLMLMGSDHRTYCFAAALFCSLISQCKGTNPLLYSLSMLVSGSPWDRQNSDALEGRDGKGMEGKGNEGERRRPNRISDSRERWIKIRTEDSLGIYLLVLWLFCTKALLFLLSGWNHPVFSIYSLSMPFLLFCS